MQFADAPPITLFCIQRPGTPLARNARSGRCLVAGVRGHPSSVLLHVRGYGDNAPERAICTRRREQARPTRRTPVIGRGEAVANQLDPDAFPWATFENRWGKSELKLLRCSIVKESYTVIVRWPPGIVVPRHRHFGDVHVHTFKGRWHYKEYEWSAGPGSYVFEARGATCGDREKVRRTTRSTRPRRV